MICHKLKTIERMAEGEGLQAAYEDFEIKGVAIDSRTIMPGNLFVPIIRQLDGHDYVAEAFANGAKASFWQKDHPNAPSNLPLIYVDDCLKSLQVLAANYRSELPAKVIGITGSNGKTTTKDMITSVLGTTYKVHKTSGNLNSQIGVPLTILAIDKKSEVAIIEMGMSERGQIDSLSCIAKPDIAIITMIGVSHISNLGSREEIANAKLEIINGLHEDGILIYHGDEPLLTNRLISSPINTVTFGEGKTNDLWAESIISNSEGCYFTVGKITYYVPLLGAHNISNALATISVASIFGISANEVDKGFRSLKVTGMRMEKIESTLGFTIINDAWNASPVSMSAALKTFGELSGYSRKFVVLGDMLELGDKEEDYHREIGKVLNPQNIDFVYTIGNLGKYIALEALRQFPLGKVQMFLNKDALGSELLKNIKADDIVLLKASRGVQLETLLNKLL